MSRVMKITQRIIFVILICVCPSSSQISAAQHRGTSTPGEPPNDSANLPAYSTQPVSITGSLAESLSAFSPSYTKSEPLLLLLCGIAMFAGATTVKRAAGRKRSSIR